MENSDPGSSIPRTPGASVPPEVASADVSRSESERRAMQRPTAGARSMSTTGWVLAALALLLVLFLVYGMIPANHGPDTGPNAQAPSASTSPKSTAPPSK